MRYPQCLTLLLLGCASAPDVNSIGDGHYAVAATTASQASNGQAIARAEAVRKASAFCAQKSQAENAETFNDQSEGRAYSTTLVFSCR